MAGPGLSRPLAALVVSAILLSPGRSGAIAQTPRAEPPGEAVAPELCLVEPRPLAFYEPFVGATATPLPAVTAPSLGPDAGVLADAATVAAVTALERQAIACVNTGDARRIDALKTDESLRRHYGANPFSQAIFDQVFAAPPVPPATPYRLVAVSQVVLLPDGRVGACVAYAVPAEPGVTDDLIEVTDFNLYRQVDGRFLIDGIVEEPPGCLPPTAATPTTSS